MENTWCKYIFTYLFIHICSFLCDILSQKVNIVGIIFPLYVHIYLQICLSGSYFSSTLPMCVHIYPFISSFSHLFIYMIINCYNAAIEKSFYNAEIPRQASQYCLFIIDKFLQSNNVFIFFLQSQTILSYRYNYVDFCQCFLIWIHRSSKQSSYWNAC